MSRTMLTIGFGVPVALLAMTLLFAIEAYNLTGRKRPMLLAPLAAITTCLLVGIVVARFAEYA